MRQKRLQLRQLEEVPLGVEEVVVVKEKVGAEKEEGVVEEGVMVSIFSMSAHCSQGS